MDFNLNRKSYFFNKLLIRTTSRLVNLVKKPFYKKKKKLASIYSSVVILMKPNNTFVSVVKSSDSKIHVITAGLAGFSGPKRSSPYSRHVVARKMSNYLFYNKLRNIDVSFNTIVTKRYFFLFKGLIVKPPFIRFLARNRTVSHGKLRKKKQRRK